MSTRLCVLSGARLLSAVTALAADVTAAAALSIDPHRWTPKRVLVRSLRSVTTQDLTDRGLPQSAWPALQLAIARHARHYTAQPVAPAARSARDTYNDWTHI